MSDEKVLPEDPNNDPTPAAEEKTPSRRDFIKIAGAGVVAAGAAAIPAVLQARNQNKPPVTTPTIECFERGKVSLKIRVCAPAGGTGLPAGFSLQWMTCAEYAANGDMWYLSDDPRLCKASFSGNANLSRYDIGAGQCVIVRPGDFLLDSGASTQCPVSLNCGTCYVFRAFGHATSQLNRSAFTGNLVCETLPCDEEPLEDCTYTQGFWKTHGPGLCASGQNTNAWPVTTLKLGTVDYTDAQLCSILQTPNGGNGLIILAHQLIAAKLNIANNATGTAVAATIASADALIGGLLVPPVGSWSCSKGKCSGDYLTPSQTSLLTLALDDYNQGFTGPGHCG